jgi:hypothetical protein
MNNLLPIEDEEILEPLNDGETEEDQDTTVADLAPDTELDTTSGQYSIEYLLKEFKDQRLSVPFYQRRKGVWTTAAKSELIDSVFKHVPLGSITVFEKKRGSRDVVDGLQRLNTLSQFRDNEFSIELPKLHQKNPRPWAGKRFQELDLEHQERFDRHLLTLQIIRLRYSELSEDAVDQNAHFIFERMNKNVKPLNSVEIDMAVLHSEFLDKLKELTDKEFYWSHVLKIKKTSQAYSRYHHLDYLVKALAIAELLETNADEPFKNYQPPMKQLAMNYLKRAKKLQPEEVKTIVDTLHLKIQRLEKLNLNALVYRGSNGRAIVTTIFQNMMAYYLKYFDSWSKEIISKFFSDDFKEAFFTKQNFEAKRASTTSKKILITMFQWLEEQRKLGFSATKLSVENEIKLSIRATN